MDPESEFARLLTGRRAQLATDGDVTAVLPGAERVRTIPAVVADDATAPEPEPEPDEVGEPVSGAMAVLALAAFAVSVVLTVCRIAGKSIGVLEILAPTWGSALLVAAWALAHAIPAAAADARDWVRKRGH